MKMNPSHSALSARVVIIATSFLCAGYLYSEPGKRQTSSVQDPAATTSAGLREEEIARHSAAIRGDVERTYGRALSASGFAGPDLARIVDLLIERQLAALDANKIATRMHTDDTIGLQKAIRKVQSDIDSEIIREFGEQKFATIKLLIDGSSNMRVLLDVFEPALIRAGVPLKDQQLVPFLGAMVKNYGTLRNPRFLHKNTNLDAASGLNVYDRLLLQEVGSFLSANQVAILANAIGERNRAIRSKQTR